MGSWLAGLPLGCTLSQCSLVLRHLHFITLIPGFLVFSNHLTCTGAKAALQQPQVCLVVFNAALQTDPRGAWLQCKTTGAPPTTSAQPGSQKSDLPLQVQPHLLRSIRSAL